MPVGATLQRLRRERGKTLPDVEQATRIMGRLLTALENERWDELPAPVYVRGYIQNYATFLGVDPQPLLQEYAADTAVHRERPERGPLQHIPERTVVPHRLDVHAIPRGVWLAAAAAVIVVVLAVWGVAALLGRDDSPPPIPPETTGTPSVGTTGTPGEASEAFILRIEVAEGQTSWLQVRVDGLIAYEGTMPSGETREWTVSDLANVQVSKPSAVTLTRDGAPVAIPAPPAAGAPSEVTLTADAP